MQVNVQTLKLIDIMNHLAKIEPNGLINIEDVTHPISNNRIYYDMGASKKNKYGIVSYRVVYDADIFRDNYIVNKYYDDDFDNCEISVVDMHGSMYLCVYFKEENECVTFKDGEWHFNVKSCV